MVEVHRLLEKHRMLEAVASRQDTPKSALLEQMQHRQNLAELQRRLRGLHPADLAHLLESLPIDDRLVVWRELTPALAGPALVEVTREVRESLIEQTEPSTLAARCASSTPTTCAIWRNRCPTSWSTRCRRCSTRTIDPGWNRVARYADGLGGAADDAGPAQPARLQTAGEAIAP